MTTFSLPSTCRSATLACYVNECSAPRAMVQISHGMCEYVERYTAFAEYLGARGYLVFGHDHVGHGHTAQAPDDLGFTVSGGGADTLVEDVHALSLYMKKQHPALPLILFGHSMGSFIAREAAARHGSTYTAAVFCGTGGPEAPAGAGKLLARLLMLFFGEHHRSKLLKSIAFAGYNKKYESVRTQSDWLTRDTAVVDRYLADPLCNYTFTVRAYHDLFTLLQAVSRSDWARRLPKELPILVMGGEMDPVGNWGKGTRTVAERLRSAGLDTALHLYPDMRHEVLNELGHERVMKETEQWMNKFLRSNS